LICRLPLFRNQIFGKITEIFWRILINELLLVLLSSGVPFQVSLFNIEYRQIFLGMLAIAAFKNLDDILSPLKKNTELRKNTILFNLLVWIKSIIVFFIEVQSELSLFSHGISRYTIEGLDMHLSLWFIIMDIEYFVRRYDQNSFLVFASFVNLVNCVRKNDRFVFKQWCDLAICWNFTKVHVLFTNLRP